MTSTGSVSAAEIAWHARVTIPRAMCTCTSPSISQHDRAMPSPAYRVAHPAQTAGYDTAACGSSSKRAPASLSHRKEEFDDGITRSISCRGNIERVLQSCRDEFHPHSGIARQGTHRGILLLPVEAQGRCGSPAMGKQEWTGPLTAKAFAGEEPGSDDTSKGDGDGGTSTGEDDTGRQASQPWMPTQRAPIACGGLSEYTDLSRLNPFAHGRASAASQRLTESLSDACGAALFFLAVEWEPCSG